jgi:hypothetical protein
LIGESGVCQRGGEANILCLFSWLPLFFVVLTHLTYTHLNLIGESGVCQRGGEATAPTQRKRREEEESKGGGT